MNDSGNFKGLPVTRLDDHTVLPETAHYLNSIDAKPINLRTAYIDQSWLSGKYYRHWARVRFDDDGTVTVTPAYMAEIPADDLVKLHPSAEEQTKIKAEWAGREWPHITTVAADDRYGTDHPPEKLIEALKQANPKGEFDPMQLFYFKRPRTQKEREGGAKGNLLMMVQQRIEREDGGKFYVNWTPWSDGIWRKAEPDKLPLYGLDKLGYHTHIGIHEGCKGPRLMHDLAARDAWHEHPWGAELQSMAHVGVAGGAGNIERTDFSPLKDFKHAFIFEDNDTEGKEATPEVAKQLRCVTEQIQFGEKFENGFDLGDPFPEEMFEKLLNGGTHYNGPTLKKCMYPHTWMTNSWEVTGPKGGNAKTMIALRRHAASTVIYIERQDQYLHPAYPWRGLQKPEALNRSLVRRSESNNTELLLARAQRQQVIDLTYDPSQPTGIITGGYFNLHMKTVIRPHKGDGTPFLKFMEHLMPDQVERHEALRWSATLIGRPAVRMMYGLLTAGTRQGSGKTTLGLHILAPLVGEDNFSAPSEENILSDYNDWAVNMRLVVIGEIYQGESWKMYNHLKSPMTDPFFQSSIKYQRGYKVRNWSHYYASSNSLKALKIENADRRWLVVHASERLWGKQRFIDFYHWLERQGGLSIILHWAQNQAEDFYLTPADEAPDTETKRQMIRSTTNTGIRYFLDIVKEWDSTTPQATSASDLTSLVLQTLQSLKAANDPRFRDCILPVKTTLRNAVVGLKCSIWDVRMDVPGQDHDKKHYVLLNSAATEEAERLIQESGDDAKSEIRKRIKGDWWVHVGQLLEQGNKKHDDEDEPF